MKKNKFMNKGTALFGAIAMVMIAVVSIVGVTFAWFSASPDPRVTGIRAEVAGAETLQISHLGTDGTFSRILTWTSISTNPHAQANLPAKLTSVTPQANRTTGEVELGLNNRLQFYGDGMEFCPDLFEDWFVANETTRDTVLGETFATYDLAIDKAMEMGIIYSGLPSTWANHPAFNWYKYKGGVLSYATTPGTGDGGWYFFPLFFRASSDTDIYIALPTADGGHDNTFADSRENGTIARQIISQSVRFAFVHNGETVVYKPQPEIVGGTNAGAAANLTGDLLDTRGGGNIVPNIYNAHTWASVAGTIPSTDIVKGGPEVSGANLLKIGTTDAFDDSTTALAEETTTRIDIYIWVDGNDIYNTNFAANSNFIAQLQFYGIAKIA
ncbi:MAG: hypothetical protein FWD49_03245 [Firmicutes bacterium]|nr:hypothetical protein [Bacillota bacterium]